MAERFDLEQSFLIKDLSSSNLIAKNRRELICLKAVTIFSSLKMFYVKNLTKTSIKLPELKNLTLLFKIVQKSKVESMLRGIFR
jgi:hypothetical protein